MKTFTDSRDGNSYRIIKINNLYWFAENLKYQGISHHFPNRNSDNVPQYGCLYDWSNAMKACPEGWRLPTKDEFEQLLTATGAKNNSSDTRDSFWETGSDFSQFGTLPAGYSNYSGYFGNFGSSAHFWSATLSYYYDNNCAYRLRVASDVAYMKPTHVNYAFSVRCVKEV